jgi:hypothetical protein
MDIEDITKHPFKIECPAELKDFPAEPFGDHWIFKFDNGYCVSCIDVSCMALDDSPTTWEVAIIKPPGGSENLQVIGQMSDKDGEISELIDRIAHLEKP